MKRFIFVLIMPFLFLEFIKTIAVAATDESCFEYTIKSGNSVVITGLSDGYLAELEIPAELDGMPVTEIGAWAFSECDNLTGVIIPYSVTIIGI